MPDGSKTVTQGGCRSVVGALALGLAALAAPVPGMAQEGEGAAPQPAVPAPQAAASAAADAPVQRLERVEIRGRRQGTQGSVLRLDGREAAQVPGAGTDALKALQSLPGVTSSNDASSEPIVRGSRPGDNAYLVDGVPAGYLFHVGGLTSVLPGELIQQFDLHSAAFGPQFPDVTGAVLDVALRAPRTDRFGIKLDLSLLGSGVIAEGPLGADHAALLAVRRSYVDLLARRAITDEDTGAVVRLPRYGDYQFKYLWRPDAGQRLALSAHGASDHIDFRVPAGSTVGRQEPALVGEGRDDSRYDTQALAWEIDRADGGANRLALGRTTTRFAGVAGSAADFGVRLRSDYLREELHLRPHARHQLWLGATLERVRADLRADLLNARCTEFEAECDLSSAARTRLLAVERFDSHSLHVQERWQADAAVALTLGLRHSVDHYLKRRHTEPRLGVEITVSADTRLLAAWGRHHQQPAAQQILRDLGNPRLASLRARHAMVGVQQALGDGWSARLEVYDKDLQDLVVADPALSYRNGGSGNARGIELLLRKAEGPGGLSGWLSASWARSSRRNDLTGERFDFEFEQPLVVSLVGRQALGDNLSLGAKWSYHSGSLYTPIVGNRIDAQGRIRPVYAALNSARLPPYHRLDLRLDRRFGPRTTLYAELINAYNRKNVSGYTYSADYLQRKPETQLPALISLGAQWEF